MAHDGRLLAAALGEQKRSLDEAGRAKGLGYPAQVTRAVAYIHGHLFDPGLNAEGVRSGCGLRNHNLTTRFHQAVGVTLRGYIEAQRLDVAARLLRALPTTPSGSPPRSATGATRLSAAPSGAISIARRTSFAAGRRSRRPRMSRRRRNVRTFRQANYGKLSI